MVAPFDNAGKWYEGMNSQLKFAIKFVHSKLTRS